MWAGVRQFKGTFQRVNAITRKKGKDYYTTLNSKWEFKKRDYLNKRNNLSEEFSNTIVIK